MSMPYRQPCSATLPVGGQAERSSMTNIADIRVLLAMEDIDTWRNFCRRQTGFEESLRVDGLAAILFAGRRIFPAWPVDLAGCRRVDRRRNPGT